MRKLAAAAVSLFCLLPASAFAASEALNRALEIGGATGLKGAQADESVVTIVAPLIKTLLSMTGIILVVLIVYGGMLWMTAGGSDEKVTKGKKTLTNAIIGIIIVFAAYAITDFIVSRVTA